MQEEMQPQVDQTNSVNDREDAKETKTIQVELQGQGRSLFVTASNKDCIVSISCCHFYLFTLMPDVSSTALNTFSLHQDRSGDKTHLSIFTGFPSLFPYVVVAVCQKLFFMLLGSPPSTASSFSRVVRCLFEHNPRFSVPLVVPVILFE